MARKPSITVVGPGNLGSAMARALHAAGYRLDELVYHAPASRRRAQTLAKELGAPAVELEKARFGADVTWLCVPDAAIASCAAALSRGEWQGKIVLHASGALPSRALRPLQKRGAYVASLHPMMTFVHSARPSLAGVTFAVEGDRQATLAARRIAIALGGRVVQIKAAAKPLYHAFGAFTSPLLIAVLAAAEKVARAAGLAQKDARAAARPILEQTLRNYLARGPAAAFSGPLVRGDVDTIRRHLRALCSLPEVRAAYLALVRSALRTLPVRNKGALTALLGEASGERGNQELRIKN